MNNSKSGSARGGLLLFLFGIIGAFLAIGLLNGKVDLSHLKLPTMSATKVATPSGATNPIYGQLYQTKSVDAEASMVIAMPGGADPSVETDERRLLKVSEKIIKMGINTWFIRDLSGVDYVVYPFGGSGPTTTKIFEEVESEPYDRSPLWKEPTL